MWTVGQSVEIKAEFSNFSNRSVNSAFLARICLLLTELVNFSTCKNGSKITPPFLFCSVYFCLEMFSNLQIPVSLWHAKEYFFIKLRVYSNVRVTRVGLITSKLTLNCFKKIMTYRECFKNECFCSYEEPLFNDPRGVLVLLS